MLRLNRLASAATAGLRRQCLSSLATLQSSPSASPLVYPQTASLVTSSSSSSSSSWPKPLRPVRPARREKSAEDEAHGKDLLEQLVNSGGEKPLPFYMHCLKVASSVGDTVTTEACMKLAEDRGFEIPGQGYSMLVKAYVEKGDMEGASVALKRMKAKSFLPSVFTYTAVIGGWAQQNIQRAEALLVEMMEEKVEPTVATYTVLLKKYCKDENREAVEATWQRMKEKLSSLDEIAYTTLIIFKAKTGQAQEAEALVDEMKALGIQPQEIVYSFLSTGYRVNGNVEKAEQAFQEMQAKGLTPSEGMYQDLVKLCAKAKKADRADYWKSRLDAAGFKMTQHTAGALMDEAAERGDYARCDAILVECHQNGTELNRVLFNTAMKARVNCGDMAGAEQWFQEMLKHKNCIPDIYTFNTLFHGYLRFGKLQEAYQVLDRMREAGVVPTEEHKKALAAAQERSLGPSQKAAAEKEPEAASGPAATAASPSVLWVEELGPHGTRLFRSTREPGVVQSVPPTSGFVQLNSEFGKPYFWDVAKNVTSWDPPP